MSFPASFLRRIATTRPYARGAQPQRVRTMSETPAESDPIELPPMPTVDILNRLPHHMLGSKATKSSMRPVLLAGILAAGAGMAVIAESDVLAMSNTFKGVVWFEKNKDRLTFTKIDRKLILEKGGGKWRARVEREEKK